MLFYRKTWQALKRRFWRPASGSLVLPLLRSFGVWTYECGQYYAAPYARLGEVPRPIELQELDDETRRRFKDARLPVRFREARAVAPGEFVPVGAWDPVWFDTAGRPHPTEGNEGEFRKLLAQHPDLSMGKPVQPREAEIFEGEALYKAVEKLLSSPGWPWAL